MNLSSKTEFKDCIAVAEYGLNHKDGAVKAVIGS